MSNLELDQAHRVVHDYLNAHDAAAELARLVDEDHAALWAELKAAQVAVEAARAKLDAARQADPRATLIQDAAAKAAELRGAILEQWDSWFPGTQTPPGLAIQRRTTRGIRVEGPFALIEELYKRQVWAAGVKEEKLRGVFETKFVRGLLDAGVKLAGAAPEDVHTLVHLVALTKGAA